MGPHMDIFLEREWTLMSCFLKTMTRLSSVSLMPGTLPGTEGHSADVCGVNLSQKPGESGVFYSPPPAPIGW